MSEHILYITYSESEDLVISDADDHPYHRRKTTFSIMGVYTSDPGGYNCRRETVDWKPGTQAIVLVRRYDDNNTFGRDLDCWDIEGVYPDITTAREAREALEKRTGWDAGRIETYPSMIFH